MDVPQEKYLKVGPYLETFQGVRTALKINEGIIKVVGVEGAGKTSLCDQLISELEAENQDVVYFETPPDSPETLFQHIQTVLGLDKNKDFNRALTRYLLETSSKRKLIIVYNDAEKISKDLFILIRLLNNIHDDSSTLVSQIITGTNKLDTLFDDPFLRSLTQYLNQSFTLSPMSREQLDDFYSIYKKDLGITDKDMSNKELTELYLKSKGLPGKVKEILNSFFSANNATVETETLLSEPEPEPEPGILAVESAAVTPTIETEPENSLAEPESESLAVESESETPATAYPAQSTHENSETPVFETRNDFPVEQESLEQEPEEEALFEVSAEEMPILMETLVAETPLPKDAPRNIKVEEKIENQDAFKTIDTQESFLTGLEFITQDNVQTEERRLDEQELNSILDADNDKSRNVGPAYFKIGLSAAVVITAMVLAFLLSGNNENVNNKLVEILAADTPLYMDEVRPEVVRSNTAQSETVQLAASEPVQENDNQLPALTSSVFPVQPDQQSNQQIEPQMDLQDSQESAAAQVNSDISLPDSVAEISALEAPKESSPPALVTASVENLETQSMIVDETDTELNTSLDQQISATLSQWVSAWRDGDFQNYIAAYHDEFRPSSHDSYAAWQTQRRDRVQGAQGITISYDRLEITELFGNEVIIRFWLQYAKGSYADDTLKEIRLLADGERWLIQSERNIDVVNISY